MTGDVIVTDGSINVWQSYPEMSQRWESTYFNTDTPSSPSNATVTVLSS